MNLKIINWAMNFFDFILNDKKSVSFPKGVLIMHERPILLDKLGSIIVYNELDVDERFFAKFLINSTIGQALLTFLNFHDLNFLFLLINSIS